jgi:transposase
MLKRKHSALVKFKVALAALTGQPIVEICKQYEIGDGLVHKWKNQLKEHGALVFNGQNKAQKNDDEQEKAKLYQRIGQLTTELEYLKKVVEG